jgi:small subunit ribosomal protein S17
MTSDANKTVQPRTKVGIVESDKRDKTRTVVIRWTVKHPKYGKYLRRKTVLQVHDAANESRSGDVVEVEPCRPISKTKTWRLVRVVEKNKKVSAVQV